MNILGIETSCDETSAAIVKQGKYILSNIVTSSLKEHKQYGGVIPEIASRRQLECINPVVKKALSQAKLKIDDVDAIAVTSYPGLIGSLLVGISYAKALSFSIKKPFIEVDHIKAHLYSSFLKDNKSKSPNIKLPVIGLVVSGGHTSLYHIKDFSNFKCIGHTLDDAAGEAFDKVAKILNLGYPGGPIIDKLSKKSKKNDIRFTCAKLPDTFNFSFSGIKTGVLYHNRDNKRNKGYSINDVAFGFQTSIVENLVDKSILACKKYKVKDLIVGGGVAANSYLRDHLINKAKEYSTNVHFPNFSLCTDNAAMIAGLGFHIRKGRQRRVCLK